MTRLLIQFFSLLAILGFCSAELHAQEGSRRVRYITGNSDTVLLDSQIVIASSLQVFVNDSATRSFWFDPLSRKFVWLGPQGAELKLSYQVLLFDFNRKYRHKDPKLIEPRAIGNPFAYTPSTARLPGGAYDGVNFRGNLSRGVGFGNNQDLVVNSNLNLQLSGRLNNDVDVLAAISDQDNPIQPEGNTQQLQDFDRVFIQLSKDMTRVLAGDFEMARPPGSYFMNYYKKSRGLQFAHADSAAKGILAFSGEAAISRGRFARNIITAVEGNQGPYRLSGVNGEIFIIIISGTEAVYLDGEKLQRGEQYDYVINYNTGEITFMPRRIITRYSRIIAEFQYSDRNFARTVFRAGSMYENEKLRLRVNYFSEQDLKNQPFQQTLDDTAKKVLASVGDSLQDAVLPGARYFSAFDPEKINYRLIDSLGYKVFVYTTDPGSDTSFYQVSFSFLGEGRGDYVIAQTAANGRVYSWVDPSGGQKGSYGPVTPLIAPNRQQMLSVGADMNVGKHSIISAELAYTDKNQNTFSLRDKADDRGVGIKLGAQDTRQLKKDSGAWILSSGISYEFVSRTFRYVERYRSVEFERQWARQLNNPGSSFPVTEEHIASVNFNLRKGRDKSYSYGLNTYNRGDGFRGLQQNAAIQLNWKGLVLSTGAELLQSSVPESGSKRENGFYSYRASIARPFRYFTLGARYLDERNSYNYAGSSQLLDQSYAFNEKALFLQSPDTFKLRYRLDATRRDDYLPSDASYSASTQADNIGGTVEHISARGNRLLINSTYRELRPLDTSLFNIVPEKSLLSRIEYDLYMLRRSIISNTFYQIGTGQEQRREFTYLEVPAGNGIYAWVDYNSDGIQQLNEFEIAAFKDQARFIRVFVPVAGFISSRFNQLNQTISINPPQQWRSMKGLIRFIGRLNLISNYNADRRTLDKDLLRSANPFILNSNDEQQLSLNSTMRHTLFFNRSGPEFGFDVSYLETRNRYLLNTGIDRRLRKEQSVNIRWNFSESWGLNLGSASGERSFNSQYFTERNYAYQFYRVEPRLTWQYKTSLRITGFVGYFDGQNREEFGGERAINREIGTEIRYNLLTKGSLSARLALNRISFDGIASSPLGYEMLQGMQPGDNKTWNISLQQRISNNIQLNIQYDGRKTETARTVHIGRVEARYIF